MITCTHGRFKKKDEIFMKIQADVRVVETPIQRNTGQLSLHTLSVHTRMTISPNVLGG